MTCAWETKIWFLNLLASDAVVLSFRRCNGCEVVLKEIEAQVVKANTHKENQTQIQNQIDSEVRRSMKLSLCQLYEF